MMNYTPPSRERIQSLFISTPHYFWPTFAHQPLNCFDLTKALLTFPGDISKDRAQAPSYYANYCIDIDDLATCPRRYEITDADLWTEEGTEVRWRLGTVEWACIVEADGLAISQGFFRTLVGVTRYQNIDGVTDINDEAQLRLALYASVQGDLKIGAMQPFAPETIFSREIGGRTWHIARSLDGCNYPTYEIVSPIDHRTTICISATLSSCWHWEEIVPAEVEEKHLESLWDFLAHVSLQYGADGTNAIGTTARDAPGQAAKEAADSFEW